MQRKANTNIPTNISAETLKVKKEWEYIQITKGKSVNQKHFAHQSYLSEMRK
jgi:hypothetical protein